MKIYFAGHAAHAKGGRGGEKSLVKKAVTHRLLSFYWKGPVQASLKVWEKEGNK